jgi:hypothetical protein
MRRTLDRIGGVSALVVALWPLIYWILWSTVHMPNDFVGFDARLESLYYPVKHPVLWRLSTLPAFAMVAAITLMLFVASEYIRHIEPLWSRLIVWLGTITVLANLLEAIMLAGIMPWLAEHSSPQEPQTAGAYLALRAILWIDIWLAVISTSTTTGLISVLLLVRKAAPRVWCYLGLLQALVGLASLEGAKSLRIAQSLIAVVWMLWLAVLFFRGTLVKGYGSGADKVDVGLT